MKGKTIKTTRKLFSLIAAIAMVFGLAVGFSAVPAKAAKGDVTVTKDSSLAETATFEKATAAAERVLGITTPNASLSNTSSSDYTYTVYKIFGATKSGNNVAYTDDLDLLTSGDIYDTGDENTATAKFQKDGGNVAYYTRTATDNGSGSITYGEWVKDSSGSATLNAEMISQLSDKTSSFTKYGTVKIEGTNNTGYVKLDYGYYYVTSTTGTVVAINTNKSGATVGDKNTAPTVTKTESDSASQIGDTVTYTVTLNLPKGSTNVKFFDTLSSGLTLSGDAPTSVKVGDTALNTTDNYTVTYFSLTKGTSGDANGKNIVITFNDDYTKALTTDTTVTITYSATVNNEAVINESNDAYVTYGSNYESTHSTVYESTFKLNVKKTDGTNALTGAEFVLSKNSDLGDLKKDSSGSIVTNDSNATNKESNLIKFGTSGNTVLANQTESNASNYKYLLSANGGTSNNELTINGLDAYDTNHSSVIYYLYEVKAPDGYNKLTNPISIKVVPTYDSNDTTKVTSYKVTYASGNLSGADTNPVNIMTDNTSSYTPATFNIVNSTGSLLPSTGGIGTTIFYIAGGLLVAGALVFLIKRKKSQVE